MTDSLRPEGLDHLLAADRLLHHAVELAQVLLQLAEALARVAGDEVGEPEHDRDDQQARPAPARDRARTWRPGCRPCESTLASSEVTFCETAWLMASMSLVRRLISSPAGLRVEEAQGQRLQVGEQVAAQRFEGALRDVGHEPAETAWKRLFKQVDDEHPAGRSRASPADLLARR